MSCERGIGAGFDIGSLIAYSLPQDVFADALKITLQLRVPERGCGTDSDGFDAGDLTPPSADPDADIEDRGFPDRAAPRAAGRRGWGSRRRR